MTEINAIQLTHLTCRFGNFKAVDNLSLSIQPGEIFGLLGPNGAGKTTTLRMITGLLRPSQGTAQLFGLDPQKEAREVRKRIGMVAQDTNLYADLNAIENLEHHAALYCPSLKGIEAQIEEQLKRMSLWERRKDPVRTFSGGMKRRLALARALLHQPQVIFFDEPTLGVDVQARHVLWEHIHQQRADGKTFVISTNDMNEAEALCDRLAILDQGKLIALDTPEALKNTLGRDAITLKTTPRIENPAALFQELDVHLDMQPDPDSLRLEISQAEKIVGEVLARLNPLYHLESLQVSKPSLDDVFLHYTGRGLRE